MFAVFECVALAIRKHGLRGLTEVVPGGPYLFDVVGEALRLYRERRKVQKLREEMAQLAAASAEEARRAAEQVARRVVNQGPLEDRIALERYLTQLPDAVRRSLDADDPPAFAEEIPEELAEELAAILPAFPPGAGLKEEASRPNPPAPFPRREGGVRDRRLTPPSLRGKGAGGLGASPTPLEGGAAGVTVLPFAIPTEPETWFVPLRGTWCARPAATPDSHWSPGLRLPAEVVVRPGEAYRVALDPNETDVELAEFAALAGLRGLEGVDLSGCARVTDAGLLHLARLRGLKALGLADTGVSDSGVALLLTRFPDLEAVGLAGAAGVSPAVVPHLARLRKLRLLSLPPRADSPEARVEFARRRPACRLV